MGGGGTTLSLKVLSLLRVGTTYRSEKLTDRNACHATLWLAPERNLTRIPLL